MYHCCCQCQCCWHCQIHSGDNVGLLWLLKNASYGGQASPPWPCFARLFDSHCRATARPIDVKWSWRRASWGKPQLAEGRTCVVHVCNVIALGVIFAWLSQWLSRFMRRQAYRYQIIMCYGNLQPYTSAHLCHAYHSIILCWSLEYWHALLSMCVPACVTQCLLYPQLHPTSVQTGVCTCPYICCCCMHWCLSLHRCISQCYSTVPMLLLLCTL